MTKSPPGGSSPPPRGESPRGGRRRDDLVAAGVALLADAGPAALTTRAVAERAGANVGLIHYHFGGAGPLRAAIARRACSLVIDPVVEALLATRGEVEALALLRRLLPDTVAQERITALSAHLVSAAVQDEAFAAVLGEHLRQVRARLGEWFAARHPGWPPARCAAGATLFAALIDGLFLHYTLDPALPVAETLGTLAAALEREGPGPS